MMSTLGYVVVVCAKKQPRWIPPATACAILAGGATHAAFGAYNNAGPNG